MKKTFFLILVCLAFGINLDAQTAKKPVQPTHRRATFHEIKRDFEERWKGKEPSEEESENAEEGGWQQFKRWEWFAEQRTFPTGVFPAPDILFNECRQYRAREAQRSSNQAMAANWSFIGPGVVPTGGGGSGRINCITFDPINPQIIWVGAACGGVWRSPDGGVTWTSNTDLLPALSISEIVIDPTNPQIMYLATGDKYGVYSAYATSGHYSAGVLKSTDGGITWNPTGLTYVQSDVTLIERLIIDPSNTNILYAATDAGILKTTDAGVTWNNILTGSFYDIEFHPTNSSILYTGDITGFLRSTNSGTSWSYVSGVVSTGRTSIAVTPANPACVYVWTEGGDFYNSTNSGVSFNILNNPSTNCTPYGYYDMVLEVSPVNDQVLFVGGMLVASSTNGGSTWTTVSNWSNWNATSYVHADNHALQFAPGSSTDIYSCNDGGIFHSTDQGGTWGDLSSGLHIKQYYRLSSSAQTTNLIYAGAQDNGTDKITGLNTATRVYGADGEGCLVDYTNDNVVFISYQGGNFFRSTDGGVTFSSVGASGNLWTSPITMDPTNNNIIYIGGTDVWKSTDNGVTWSPMGGTFDGLGLYTIEICKSQPNTMYVASYGNIYRTTNGGTTWTNISGGLPGSAFTGIAVKDSDPNTAWVSLSGYAAGNKVYYTNDGGTTWTNVSGTLPNVPTNCIEYQNGSNDALYLGTDMGVFYMDGTMTDWVSYNTGLPNVIIDQLEVSYSNSKLRAATYGRGLWESDLQLSTLQNVDAATTGLINPPLTSCSTVLVPVVSIKNAGADTLTSVDLHYSMDGQAFQVANWNGSLASLSATTLSLPSYTLSVGTHTLEAYTANPNLTNDMNALNDTIVRTFTILVNPPGSPPPVAEGFTTAVFPPNNFTLENSSALLSRNTSAGGYGNSAESMRADFYSIPGGEDNLATPYIDFTNAVAPITLYFDVAYAQYDTMYHDSLIIDLFRNCPGIGERVYAKGDAGLATALPTTSYYTPVPTEWRTDTLHLDSLAGKGALSIRFIAKTGYGNNMYIDNINLTANSNIGIQTLISNGVLVFPNPASNDLWIEMADGGTVQLSMFDMLGNKIRQSTEKIPDVKNRLHLDVSDLREGMYLVKVQTSNGTVTKRITVAR